MGPPRDNSSASTQLMLKMNASTDSLATKCLLLTPFNPFNHSAVQFCAFLSHPRGSDLSLHWSPKWQATAALRHPKLQRWAQLVDAGLLHGAPRASHANTQQGVGGRTVIASHSPQQCVPFNGVPRKATTVPKLHDTQLLPTGAVFACPAKLARRRRG